MAAEYMTFQEVLDELQLTDEELKEMVNNEELRAFRDSGHVKFKTEDVVRLKEQRETQPTIILPSEDAAEEPAVAVPDAAPVITEEPDGDEIPTILSAVEPEEETGAAAGIPGEGDDIVPTIEMDAPEPLPGEIGLKDEEEETIVALDGVGAIAVEEEDSATVTQEMEPSLIKPLADEEADATVAVGEGAYEEVAFEDEPQIIAALPEEVIVPVSPIFNIMLVFGILVLVFTGLIMLDIIRQPDQIPPYLKPISDAILGK